jgi:glucose/arabinose dehydrogenase
MVGAEIARISGGPVLRALPVLLLFSVALAGLPGCLAMRSGSVGSQAPGFRARAEAPGDIVLPPGYRIERVAAGLNFPTGLAFDDQGRVHVIESGYAYGEVWAKPRLIRVESDGATVVVATGENNGPWNGLTFHQGAFYVAEGGVLRGGRILRIDPAGRITPLVENLPSTGDHQVDGPVISPDGWLYFGLGTFTNSGVVGEDNLQFGWLRRYPSAHDIPCGDLVLNDGNVTTPNPLTPDPDDMATTGPFHPFGVPVHAGEVVRGAVPCSGSILRMRVEGGPLELVAWGFRNPFGLAFSPDGKLYCTDNSYDERGSRPVFGAGDLLWAVDRGAWYGWPDFHGNHSLAEGDRYRAPGKPAPKPLLATLPGQPPRPAAVLAVHSSSDGFDFSTSEAFGFQGQAFIAQFGDQAPLTGKVSVPVGFKVVRVDVKTGQSADFAVNRGKENGPASFLGTGGLERPVACRFDRGGENLYLVDFGVMTVGQAGKVRTPWAVESVTTEPRKDTGVLWRISRSGASPGASPLE